MPGVHEQVAPGALLDDPSPVHHQYPVGDPQHRRQVVGDQHHGHPPVHLELLEQLEHLGLLGGVEHRDGLVGHQELGLEHQRPGQGHPLQLAARQLVRVAGQEVVVGGEAGGPQRRPDQAVLLLGVADVLQLEWLPHRLGHREAGGERLERILEEQLHPPPGGLELRAGGGQQVTAFELDRAFVGVEEADEHRRQRRLARPAGADEAHDLALEDLDADAVDGGDLFLAPEPAPDRIRLATGCGRRGPAPPRPGRRPRAARRPRRWEGASGGRPSPQISISWVQRPAKGQPGATSVGLGGSPRMPRRSFTEARVGRALSSAQE